MEPGGPTSLCRGEACVAPTNWGCLVYSRISYQTFRADVGLRFANPTYGFPNDINISREGAKKWAPVTACV